MQELEYTPVDCNVDFCFCLSDLLQECLSAGAEIASVRAYQTGFCVKFKDIPGFTAWHQNTCGYEDGLWETWGMPWSEEYITGHTAAELAKMIAAAQNGRDWKHYMIM